MKESEHLRIYLKETTVGGDVSDWPGGQVCKTLSVPQQAPWPSSIAPPLHIIRRSVAAVSSAIPWYSSTLSAIPTKNSPAPHDWTAEGRSVVVVVREEVEVLYQVSRREWQLDEYMNEVMRMLSEWEGMVGDDGGCMVTHFARFPSTEHWMWWMPWRDPWWVTDRRVGCRWVRCHPPAFQGVPRPGGRKESCHIETQITKD